MPHSWRMLALGAMSSLSMMIPAPAQAQAENAGKTSSATTHHKARGDDAIQDRIEHRLATDSDVRKYDIAVKVSSGVVTLNGAVATDDQKAEAARLAKVSGVVKVDNDIKVDKDVDRTLTERAKSGLTKTGEAITDAWITAKVKWFYVGEGSLKGSDITVDTNNHVVTLKGTVATAAGKMRAVELAKETDG
ncbi:MAG TPA: BON domain-containing protein, partial [Vicinamibacterales bacterium]